MKIGICGIGDISVQFVEAVQKISSLNISSLYHYKIEKGINFAKQYNIDFSTDDFEKMLETIDCVYIGLPNSLHYEYAFQSLLKGKHVIVEKPICATHRQFTKLKQLAKEKNVMIIELNRVSYLPNFRHLKEMIQSSSDIMLTTISFCKRSRRYDDYLQGKNPHIFTSKYSGGALYDLGVYALHFLIQLFGKPISYTYQCHQFDDGVDVAGVLTLNFPNNIASVQISKISNGLSNFMIQSEHTTYSSDTAVSIIKPLTIHPLHGETIHFDEQTENNMFYSVKEIARIIKDTDTKAYQYHLNNTEIVIQIMESMRLQNSIHFEEDDKN